MRRQTITVINQKGGAGKTTTAQCLGAGLMKLGYKVLFIDLDGQGNLSDICKADKSKPSAIDLLIGKNELLEAIQQTSSGDLIAGNSLLFSADTQISETGKEYKLKEQIDKLKNYEFIIIDTPPALSIVTINALTAADFAIIPTQADIMNLKGIESIHKSIELVRTYCNKKLKVRGILLTRFNDRTILNRQMLEKIKETAAKIKTKVFNTRIRENIAIREAQTMKISIFDYAPKSNAALDYEAFVKELLELE